MQMRLHDQLSTNQGLVLEFLISYHLRPTYTEGCNDYYGYTSITSLWYKTRWRRTMWRVNAMKL